MNLHKIWNNLVGFGEFWWNLVADSFKKYHHRGSTPTHSKAKVDWTPKESLPGSSCGAKRSQCAVAAFQWKMPRKLVGPRP